MPKPLRFREVRKRLSKYDKRFQWIENRGKGSERMLFHPDIGGKVAHYPVTCHGDGYELGVGLLRAIIRRFDLPKRIFD